MTDKLIKEIKKIFIMIIILLFLIYTLIFIIQLKNINRFKELESKLIKIEIKNMIK